TRTRGPAAISTSSCAAGSEAPWRSSGPASRSSAEYSRELLKVAERAQLLLVLAAQRQLALDVEVRAEGRALRPQRGRLRREVAARERMPAGGVAALARVRRQVVQLLGRALRPVGVVVDHQLQRAEAHGRQVVVEELQTAVMQLRLGSAPPFEPAPRDVAA